MDDSDAKTTRSMTKIEVRYLTKPYLPVETDAIFRAFPANVYPLMPPWEAIPPDFRKQHTPWNKLFAEWMFKGVPATAQFLGKEGIDPEIAYWHLQCVINSYQPKHQHKEAAVAYLSSLWFERVVFDDARVWGTP